MSAASPHDACGCCGGASALTGPGSPVVENRPGLSALAFRAGTHARFKASMLARLSTLASLRELTTRDDDDPTIALLDAWAAVLDVLTFYQERIANEGYLRTATERRSILELARTIGYELGPGVAASTWLAFTLDGSPGSPREVAIPAGTRAQSLPGKIELPQSFETAEEILARPEWNALQPALTEPQRIGPGAREALLAGAALDLKPGDALLWMTSRDAWDVRTLTRVEALPAQGRTRVVWARGLEGIAEGGVPRVFVLRQRAALFGHNAPDWQALPDEVRARFVEPGAPVARFADWPGFGDPIAVQIELDAEYPKIVEGSWLVLKNTGDAPRLFAVVQTDTTSRASYALSFKRTRLSLDPQVGVILIPREVGIFAQSEELSLAEAPVGRPVAGSTVQLDGKVEGLTAGRPVIVRGKRARALVGPAAQPLRLGAGSGARPLQTGETLTVLSLPFTISGRGQVWHLRGDDGVEGMVIAPPSVLALAPAGEDDAMISEVTVLKDARSTALTFKQPLAHVYDPATVTIHANVVKATHGETKREVLGSGDAARPFQRFRLRQKPLTYVSAPVPGGGASTLELRVNGVRWHEAPDLLRLGPRDRAYLLRRDDAGDVTVQLGDGVHGARPASGSENVEAVYRVGLGAAGSVAEDRITLLATRPLGVRSVTNPLPATGAADPEVRDDARRNAPRTVLTLDRVVSLRDYEDYARGFAGIGKAQARLLWKGGLRTVHLTVAAADGRPVPSGSELFHNLVASLEGARDPHQALEVSSFEPVVFRARARVGVHPDHRQEDVLPRAEAALRQTFSFAARDFGQGVALSEVMAVLQRVDGVAGVDVEALHLAAAPPSLQPRLAAWPPRLADDGTTRPGQILTLVPEPVSLEVLR